MSIVQHDGLVREALASILDALAEGRTAPLKQLLDEAGMRFNLSPLDAEKLARLLADTRQKNGEPQTEASAKTEPAAGARP